MIASDVGGSVTNGSDAGNRIVSWLFPISTGGDDIIWPPFDRMRGATPLPRSHHDSDLHRRAHHP